MKRLAWDEFAGCEGTVFQVEAEGERLPLTLEAATALPPSGRAEGSFRLEFRGPGEPILPQAIYRFHRGEDSAEIFIVPVGREEKGTLYEAVFF